MDGRQTDGHGIDSVAPGLGPIRSRNGSPLLLPVAFSREGAPSPHLLPSKPPSPTLVPGSCPLSHTAQAVPPACRGPSRSCPPGSLQSPTSAWLHSTRVAARPSPRAVCPHLATCLLHGLLARRPELSSCSPICLALPAALRTESQSGLGSTVTPRSFGYLKTCTWDPFTLNQPTDTWFTPVELWQYQEECGMPHDTPSGEQELWGSPWSEQGDSRAWPPLGSPQQCFQLDSNFLPALA